MTAFFELCQKQLVAKRAQIVRSRLPGPSGTNRIRN